MKAMAELAWEGRKNPTVRKVAETICAGIEPSDYASEVAAIYYWVCAHVRYLRDGFDLEYLQAPDIVLKSRSADCDDLSILLASMLMACGNPCRFCVVSFQKGVPSHVFCQTYVGGKWVTVDPVAGPNTHEMQNKRIVECRFFPCR
jgi:transglutaminase-like putative cysteine protease